MDQDLGTFYICIHGSRSVTLLLRNRRDLDLLNAKTMFECNRPVNLQDAGNLMLRHVANLHEALDKLSNTSATH